MYKKLCVLSLGALVFALPTTQAYGRAIAVISLTKGNLNYAPEMSYQTNMLADYVVRCYVDTREHGDGRSAWKEDLCPSDYPFYENFPKDVKASCSRKKGGYTTCRLSIPTKTKLSNAFAQHMNATATTSGNYDVYTFDHVANKNNGGWL